MQVAAKTRDPAALSPPPPPPRTQLATAAAEYSMRQFHFLLLCFLLFAASVFPVSFLLAAGDPRMLFRLLPSWPPPPPPGANSPKLIFVLAGQSNMAGRGGVVGDAWDGAVPLSCRPHPSILRFSARRRWVRAAPPLHADIDVLKTCGIGPGMPFGNAIVAAAGGSPELIVGLVPCAVGGSRIWQWARGQKLYEAAVARSGAAVAAGGGRIGAILWFQGESDTIQIEDAEAYGDKMERLIHDLRDDLGIPQLLVIHVALASGEGNYTEIVRQAQKKINLPNVVLVDAMGLPLRDDQLHLNTEAQVRLGSMLAEAYLNFNASHQ